MAFMSAFQAEDTGSIPVTRSQDGDDLKEATGKGF